MAFHLFMFPGTHFVSYHVFLVACALGLAIFDLTFLQADSEATSDPSIASEQVDTLLRCNMKNIFSFELTDGSTLKAVTCMFLDVDLRSRELLVSSCISNFLLSFQVFAFFFLYLAKKHSAVWLTINPF